MSQHDPWVNRSWGMRCKTCIWFVPKAPKISTASEAETFGRCRRHAPVMSGFPAVFDDDWCGDHKLDENKLPSRGLESLESNPRA
jgi:hypothetical protein